MKIRYIRVNKDVPELRTISKGDWIDLSICKDIEVKGGTFMLVSFGIRMKLPKGFEAWIVPRSSTGKKYKVIQLNSFGIIDNSYNGLHDEWKDPLYAFKDVKIPSGTRIAQFRIAPSMNAGIFAKLRWLLSGKVKFVEKGWKSSGDRGGFGSTGEKEMKS